MTRGVLCLLLVAISPSLSRAAENPAGDHPGRPLSEEAAGRVVTCRADLFYLWTRKAERLSESEPPTPVKTFYASFQKKAASEQAARAALNAELKQGGESAFQNCSQSHESQAACVSQKLRESSREYRTLDFARRRAFLEAVKRDCEAALGSCLKPEAGEVSCIEQMPAAIAAQPAPANSAETKAEKSEAPARAAASGAPSEAEAAAPPIPISLSGGK